MDEAQRAINAAYVETHSFPDCIGIVKLSTYRAILLPFSLYCESLKLILKRSSCAVSALVAVGRNSGFIAAWAALASREVDCCLVPEEVFVLRGSGGVLEYIEDTLNKKGSCVLVVAEGAGHEVYGNVDIGRHILSEVKTYFAEKEREINTKYLDPCVAPLLIHDAPHTFCICMKLTMTTCNSIRMR